VREVNNMHNLEITILYPIFAMVLLTAIVWFKMYYIRFSEMKKTGITAKDMRSDNRDLSKLIIESGANFGNLCEAPILFYLVCVLIILLGVKSSLLVVCAWLYVVLRYIHSFIHTTYNKIIHRFLVYFSSTLVLWFMWVILAIEVMSL
jgi:hypothetical protein